MLASVNHSAFRPLGQIALILFTSLIVISCKEKGSNIHYEESDQAIFAVGGNIYGLSGELSLTLNGEETIDFVYDTAFRFRTLLKDEQSYSVTVSNEPDGQTCSIENGVGTIDYSSVSNVTVRCENKVATSKKDSFSASSEIIELTATLKGKSLVLQWESPLTMPVLVVREFDAQGNSSKQLEVINKDLVELPLDDFVNKWSNPSYQLFSCNKRKCDAMSNKVSLIDALLKNNQFIELPYEFAQLKDKEIVPLRVESLNKWVVGAPIDGHSQYALVGSFDDGLIPNSGAVLLFGQKGHKWELEQYLKAPNLLEHKQFGQKLAITEDEQKLIISADSLEKIAFSDEEPSIDQFVFDFSKESVELGPQIERLRNDGKQANSNSKNQRKGNSHQSMFFCSKNIAYEDPSQRSCFLFF